MQVTELSAEGLKRSFSVVVPAADIEATRDKRLAALGRDLRMPGFRPGKVPMSVVKKRYGTAVTGEVLEEQVQSATRELLTGRGLRPALQPKVELAGDFADGQDLSFNIEMELLPEIPMPDFSGIEIERPRAEPSDEEVQKALDGLASRNAKLEDVTEERPAEKGDTVVADFVGRLVEGEGDEAVVGEAFPGGTAQDMPIDVGGEGFIPGFTEGLEGIRVGETRKVRVSFPEGYGSAELAGKPAEFEITAKALKKRSAAPADDEFAKSLGLESAEKLRDELRASIQREYDQLTRLRVKRSLLDQLADRADFPVPEGMVEAEFGQIWGRVEEDRKAGRLDADDAGKDEETLRAEYRKIAERRIRLGLLLSEIGRTNNIQVAQDELAQAMRTEASRYPGQERQVFEFFQKNPQALENLRAPIFEEKVVDFMLELAKVTDTTVSASDLQAA
ncbi:trigger factor [Roseomonas nepalensis]|uniref:Trigger factor n=1 Tax=Muricoccus nepalensis TaxID=1854500 RepID=A0A502GHD2_9PROT|nr:trigger factor [Roseomonas nepalensis]TPG61275.1 trigger factor [Roseomonas nepalensis]